MRLVHRSFRVVMAGLDPAIHAFSAAQRTWMPGTSPGMTSSRNDYPGILTGSDSYPLMKLE
ncbi:hypothetical protein FXV83_32085 [Bradyrhizobium hipponense]|uniref:Uncharacterized protein n=1 Tax=Bradyrhizobium hipponense TaxID=2605638 RepID=A0A5S4YDV9_9BRAD|nr:hypothetical protein FXV83_32085 [Bradyrhizobium hipponense]